jgi:TetR/AcrR family transcriptional regulator
MKTKTSQAAPRRAPRPRKRAEQQRAVDTRLAILKAALVEFAEKGFAAASVRVIAQRTRLQHPLITYHFRNKDILWRATAQYAFAQIQAEWDTLESGMEALSPLDRLRAEYRAVFRYTVAFPEFHHFMRQESTSNNPRLKWVAQNMVQPLIDRLLPQIAALQKSGQLPDIEPIVFHYMMISLTAALSEFGPEMAATSKIAADDPHIIADYWRTVEEMVFRKSSETEIERLASGLQRGHAR